MSQLIMDEILQVSKQCCRSFFKKSNIFSRIFLWFVPRLFRERFFSLKISNSFDLLKFRAIVCPNESIALLTFKCYQTCSKMERNIHAVSGNLFLSIFPAGIYLLKVNNRKTRKRCDLCSKLTIKTPEDAIGIVLVSLLLTLNIFHTLFWCFYC